MPYIGKPYNNKYILDDQRIDYALYKLLTSFLASPGLASLSTDSAHDSFNQLIDTHQESEIIDSLIYTAISLRILMDQSKHKKYNPVVGSFTFNGKDGHLKLREAFNKIIHAEEVYFDRKEGDNYINFLQPKIFLSGKQYIYDSELHEVVNKNWVVDIDIIKYVEYAHRLF